MSKYIGFFLVLLLAQLSFSWTLPELIEGKVSLQELVEAGTSIAELEAAMEAKDGKAYAKYLRKVSKQLKAFKKQERIVVRAHNRGQVAPKVNHGYYHGDPSEVENATLEQITQYDQMFAAANEALARAEINRSTYDVVAEILGDLHRLHTNNKQIALEFSRTGKSVTYGDGIALHAEGVSIDFKDRANTYLAEIYNAYEFAFENNLLAEFFTDAMGKSSGCFPARIEHIKIWQATMTEALMNSAKMSPRSKANTILKSSVEAAMQIIEADFEQLSEEFDIVDLPTRNAAAAALAARNGHIRAADGTVLTREHYTEALRRIFQLYSPKKQSPARTEQRRAPNEREELVARVLFAETGGEDTDDEDEGRGVSSVSTAGAIAIPGLAELFSGLADAGFDEAEERQANRASYLDICVARLREGGEALPCRVEAVADDGNCGFTALGLEREEFIQRVDNAVETGEITEDHPIVRAVLDDARVGSIGEWAEHFKSNGHWVGEPQLNLIAHLYAVTIHVFALNHETNEYVLVHTFNPGTGNDYHLVHINLAGPILMGGAGHHLNQNHFDRLVFEQAELAADDAPAGAMATDFERMEIENTGAGLVEPTPDPLFDAMEEDNGAAGFIERLNLAPDPRILNAEAFFDAAPGSVFGRF